MSVTGMMETRARAALDVVTAPRVRFALLAVLAGLFYCALALGSRTATLGELTSAVESGRANEVIVAGGLPRGATGYSTVTIEWREGPAHRVTTVLELSDETQGNDASSAEHIVGDVRARLLAADPSGSLTVASTEQRASTGPEVAGWTLPAWMGAAMFLLWGATLLLMVFGPEPWWATRWGWAWLLFGPAAIVGVPLYLLVSGPPPGVEQPARPGWRVPGRSTFLLVLVFGGMWQLF